MKKILFLCVANSARSQMAEGLAKNLLKQNTMVYSAGSNPSAVNPHAITVLQEIGIDISANVSKSIQSFNLTDFDLIITLCAEEVCPFVNAKVEILHWPFPDPADKNDSAEEALKKFRKTRDQIKEKIKNYFNVNS